MKGALIFVKESAKKVPVMTNMFINGIIVPSIMSSEMFFIRKKVAPSIIPTTAALIPSNDLKMTAYFFRLCHTGKKNKTRRALGKNIATDPIRQPNSCIPGGGGLFFKAIPPIKAPIEKTGPGMALTIPEPVRKSCLLILRAFGFTISILSVFGLTTYCWYIIGIKTSPPPKTRLPKR